MLSKGKWLKEMPIFCFDTSKIYDNADDCFKTTLVLEPQSAQCLKIIEKVAFDIASEASYIYILIEQIL